MHFQIYQHFKTTKYGNIINIRSTNTSFTNISTSYLFSKTRTQNSGITCQSTTSTNLLCLIPYTGVNSFNPATQNGDTLLVYELLIVYLILVKFLTLYNIQIYHQNK